MTQQTQTKQIPKGWKIERLGQIAKWGSGGTPLSSKPEYYGGDIKWAIIGDLNEGLLFDTQKKITREGLENSSAKVIPKDTLLVGMYGSIGKTAITGCEMATNQAIAFAVPKENEVILKFLKYFINLNVSTLFKLSKGDTQKNISQEVLKQVEILLPSLSEQSLIVSAIETQFTRLDEAVKSLKDVRKKLEVYRKAVLKKAFEKKEGWIVSNIKNKVKVKYGKGLPERERKEGEVPVYASAGKVGIHNKYLINFPTIIIARKGSIGNNFIVKEPCWPIDTVYYLEDIKLNLDYLFYYLNFSIFKDTSTAVPSLRREDLEMIQINYPESEKDQKKIVSEIESRFSVIDKIGKVVDKSLEKADKLRKSILKSAFEGKLVKIDEVDR
jgi:type I restriction enzyme S subunit